MKSAARAVAVVAVAVVMDAVVAVAVVMDAV